MPLDTYSLYARTFAKVASGSRLAAQDFGVRRLLRLLQPYDGRDQLAVALAVRDANQDFQLKAKAEFEAEMKRLLASP